MTEFKIAVPQAIRCNVELNQQKEDGEIRIFKQDPKADFPVCMMIESGPRQFRQEFCEEQALAIGKELIALAVEARVRRRVAEEIAASSDKGAHVDVADSPVAAA